MSRSTFILSSNFENVLPLKPGTWSMIQFQSLYPFRQNSNKITISLSHIPYISIEVVRSLDLIPLNCSSVYSVHVYKNTRRFKLEHATGSKGEDNEEAEEETEMEDEVRSCRSYSPYQVFEKRWKTGNSKVYVTFLAFSISFFCCYWLNSHNATPSWNTNAPSPPSCSQPCRLSFSYRSTQPLISTSIPSIHIAAASQRLHWPPVSRSYSTLQRKVPNLQV